MPKYQSHILELAKRGAEHRYQELKAELTLLVTHFPHLTGQKGRQVSVLDVIASKAVPASTRKRKSMSAAARKAVSARMTKYWAARRKAKRT